MSRGAALSGQELGVVQSDLVEPAKDVSIARDHANRWLQCLQ